jgi:hypothetical protein
MNKIEKDIEEMRNKFLKMENKTLKKAKKTTFKLRKLFHKNYNSFFKKNNIKINYNIFYDFSANEIKFKFLTDEDKEIMRIILNK